MARVPAVGAVQQVAAAGVRKAERTGMSEFRFDVFLSDTSADRARVKRIAERLRGAKLRVWWDEWAIKPGATSSWRSNRA